ncbi:DMT family transporter [Colwellia sp. MB02u-18]|uniref:DMT family transporter n=1 Tax=unclassified Colwellia TaxID=196834 RepID=UPI0015F6E5C1|nr:MULTISPECIES: DMT family transporter [unclassified Colwellia]MBA6222950.1 DMT family transporter [Colwellia sp. MB3u-45]MBA6266743.1 DMT family transporter [Colwellia sp. MB3u-43]MBA6295003.1 DMT family transporter [Colwellia sp. MB02u-9]MBA6320555.1 DMT family transporter [Colwellia sp. MB02u-19]MBA6323197.1 DMT family transporter [Colwellia sp. MB02u-18]
MQILLIFIVVLGGMGLSVEAGLLGPLGNQVGELWATLSIFGVGAALTFLLMLFFSPRNSASFFAQPPLLLIGGVLGPIYVIVLTVVTPVIGVAMTMIGILAGQVFKSLIIDHFGLFGTTERKIDLKRIIALAFIVLALFFMTKG